MNETQNQAVIPAPSMAVGFGFEDQGTFAHLQRVALVFSKSELIPTTFRGEEGLPNCIIALEMAKRMNASPLAVMQQIYIVHGKPSWSSQFIIACLNTCGRYSPLRFDIQGQGDDRTCFAWAVERDTQTRLEGPPVSISMAKKEGWFGKNGSKWQTMPELMMRYRAATFFGRLYAPELLMGMQSAEEVIDVEGKAEPAKIAAPIFQQIEPPKSDESNPELAPAKKKIAKSPFTPVEELLKIMVEEGCKFDDFKAWALATGQITDNQSDNINSYDEIPAAVVEKVLKVKVAMVQAIKEAKGGK
jgi:hypothetical protein